MSPYLPPYLRTAGLTRHLNRVCFISSYLSVLRGQVAAAFPDGIDGRRPFRRQSRREGVGKASISSDSIAQDESEEGQPAGEAWGSAGAVLESAWLMILFFVHQVAITVLLRWQFT